MSQAARTGVVVLDCGRPEDTLRAVRSCLDSAPAPRLLVVENGTHGIPGLPPAVELLSLGRNLGYAAGMNAGLARLRAAGCERLLLLNNDAVLEAGCLARLEQALEDQRLAAVGPVVLRGADGRVESRGARFDPRWGRFRLLDHGAAAVPGSGLRGVNSLSGAAWMVAAHALERVGGLEESYFWSFEETDWCARARGCGFELAVVLEARARHAGGLTIGPGSPDRLYYAARNHLLAVRRALPLHGPALAARDSLIVAGHLAHALGQSDLGRWAATRAVLQGARDFYAGRLGPRVGAAA